MKLESELTWLGLEHTVHARLLGGRAALAGLATAAADWTAKYYKLTH